MAAMECAKIQSFSIQKMAHPSGINLQLAVETCEFPQVPSLSMTKRPWDIKVP